MNERRARFGILWTVPLVVLLLPFIYAAFFTFPEGDDFAAAVKASFPFDFIGGIDQMFSYWWKWSGRYSHAFALVFFGDACDYRITYSAVILLSFFTLWLSAFGIACELGEKDSKGQAAFFATFWLFAVLCSYGTVHQWYLLVEIESLIAGYVFTLVYIWSLCRLWNSKELTRSGKWFSILSCVIAAGFYEHSAPLVLAVSIAAWLLSILYDHPRRKTFFLLAKISLVCFFLVYLARGNFRRQTKRGMTLATMLEQLLHAGRDWWKYVVPAYANPVYIAALFVVIWMKPRSKAPLTSKIAAPLILLGCIVLMVGFSLALAVVHALSDVTVGEAAKIPANIAQYSIVFIFFGLFACRDWLHLHTARLLGRPLTLFGVVAVLVAGNGNFFPVLWNAMSGETERYAAAYEKRKAVFSRHAGQELTVMPLFGAPVPVADDTLQKGFKSWPNKYAAPFYGMKALEARMPEAFVAYSTAAGSGRLAWDTGFPGVRLAYVSSLRLCDTNETYGFDWIFMEAKSGSAPEVRVAAFDTAAFSGNITETPEILRKIANRQWPFHRIFPASPALPFEVSGRSFFAVPLPLLDSGTRSKVSILVSLDGGEFIPVPRP